MKKLRRFLPAVTIFVILSTTSVLAGVDEYGTTGLIPGVSFTGGDGSYKRAVREGVVAGIAPDFPWTFQDTQTKQYDGVDVEIFREAAKRLGISKVTWNLLPGYGGLVPALQAKRIDVIVDNIHENPQRLQVMDFTSPAYWYGAGIAVQKGNPKRINTWADLAGKVVGALAGTIYQPAVQARKDLKQIKLYTTSSSEFADLAAGRLDAVVDDAIKIKEWITQNPGINMQLSEARLPSNLDLGYARYAVRKQDVDLNWALSRAIDEMRADGTIMHILTKFGLPASWMFSYSIPR